MDDFKPTPPHRTSSDLQHIRLACQACQRKKIKCDRTFPCGQCTRSSLHCVPSQRKPRARHAGKTAIDSELKSRIAKLESLVESLSGEVGIPNGSPDPDGHVNTPPEATSPAVDKYIGNSFWSSLTTEVQALKDALEDDADDEEFDSYSPDTSNNTPPQATVNDYDLLLCPPGAVYVMPGALQEPSPQLQATLYGKFLANINPVFRIFHEPSLRACLEQGAPYLGHDHTATQIKVLKSVLWYCAVSTMTEAECSEYAQIAKPDLLNQYRRCVDVLMAQADLVSTTDLATVQAFTVYLLASRINDLSRRTWTMVGLLVRIARAMNLHHEPTGKSPYEIEIRRRLWHQLRFLDVFTALDRGTEPLISEDSYTTLLPTHINDADFDENSTTIRPVENALTDMSFPMLGYFASEYTRRLTTADTNPHGDTWQQRLDLAKQFGTIIRERYIQYTDLSKPYHRLISLIGQSMSASMILRAVRPIVRHISSVPPRIDSPYVLQIAINCLRESERIHDDPELAHWRWFIWVHWHAIAVALAGLCSIRDTELADAGWAVVDRAYPRHSRHVADSRTGMLWRPIEKLYRKASAFRDAGVRRSISRPASSSPTNNVNLNPNKPITSPTFPTYAQFPAQTNTIDPALANNTSSPMMGFSPQMPDFNTMTLNNIPTTDNLAGLPPMAPGDMSWMDWEHIMNDLGDPNTFSGDLSMDDSVAPVDKWNNQWVGIGGGTWG